MMKKNTIWHTAVIASAFLIPLLASAKTFQEIIDEWTGWAVAALNFLLVLATLVFLWGIIKYVSAGGDAAKVKEARSYILWGIIGLAVMGSVWVIVRFLQSEVLGDDGTGNFPTYKKP